MTLSFWITGVLFFGSIPFVVAETTYSLKDVVGTLIAVIGGVLIPLSVAILFFFFVYSIIRFLIAANAGEKDLGSLAQRLLINPLLIFLFVFTIWGILEVLRLLLGG